MTNCHLFVVADMINDETTAAAIILAGTSDKGKPITKEGYGGLKRELNVVLFNE